MAVGYYSFGLRNGLAPNRRQAITRTNEDKVYWRTDASQASEELMHSSNAIFALNHRNNENN